jgi:hypothetical protein
VVETKKGNTTGATFVLFARQASITDEETAGGSPNASKTKRGGSKS